MVEFENDKDFCKSIEPFFAVNMKAVILFVLMQASFCKSFLKKNPMKDSNIEITFR